ncbi:MAG: signal peptidase II [Clostridia bacterium]
MTISFIFFGGLANVIDRSIIDVYKHIVIAQTDNAVVDYFQFTFIKNSAIFNIPDVFIVLSTLIVVVYLIISTFIHYIDKKHKNDHIEDELNYEIIKDIENEKNIETKKDIENKKDIEIIKDIKINKELIE